MDLAYEEVMPQPPEAVWAQLTDPAAIGEWLMAPDGFRPELGARFRLKTTHLAPGGWIEVEVLEIDPPRRMVWAWATDERTPPTSVTFELEPAGQGTRFRLTHQGEIDDEIGRLLRDGWPERIELLRRRL